MDAFAKLGLVIVVSICVALIAVASARQPISAAGPGHAGPSGSDGNTCLSPASPCATINGALNKPGFAAGDTILVAMGVYTGTGEQVVLFNKGAILSGGWNNAFTTNDTRRNENCWIRMLPLDNKHIMNVAASIPRGLVECFERGKYRGQRFVCHNVDPLALVFLRLLFSPFPCLWHRAPCRPYQRPNLFSQRVIGSSS